MDPNAVGEGVETASEVEMNGEERARKAARSSSDRAWLLESDDLMSWLEIAEEGCKNSPVEEVEDCERCGERKRSERRTGRRRASTASRSYELLPSQLGARFFSSDSRLLSLDSFHRCSSTAHHALRHLSDFLSRPFLLGKIARALLEPSNSNERLSNGSEKRFERLKRTKDW